MPQYHQVAVDRHTAGARIAFGDCDVIREATVVDPHDLACDRIEHDHAPASFGHVHQAVGDDRRCRQTPVVRIE